MAVILAVFPKTKRLPGCGSLFVEAETAYSISNSKVRQGGDKRATKIVQVVQRGASAEANTVSLMN